MDSLTLIHALVGSRNHWAHCWPIHWLIHIFIGWTHPFIDWLVRHWFAHSLIHSFIDSQRRWCTILSLIHRLIHWFIHPVTHSCPILSCQWLHFSGISTTSIIHYFCVSQTFLQAIDPFSKLPPRHGREISSMFIWFICVSFKISHLELQYPMFGGGSPSRQSSMELCGLQIVFIHFLRSILTGSKHPSVV